MIKRKLAKAMTALGVCLLISSSSKLNVTAIESAATVDYAPLAKIEAISAEMQQSGHLCSNCKTNMTYAGVQIVSRVQVGGQAGLGRQPTQTTPWVPERESQAPRQWR